MRFQGAVGVVTGGTSGIGRAIAAGLLERGMRVAICGRSAESVDAAVAALGDRGDVSGRICDVADVPQVDAFADWVRAELGPPSVLVNNAGLAHFTSVGDMSVEQFDETMAVNVRGVFLVTKAFLPDIRSTKGHVINIASLAGRNPVPGAAAYAASKHAVIGFSKSFFGEVRKEGIRVTAICPGSVVTPFFARAGGSVQDPDAKLTAEDVADAVFSVLAQPERALISELDIRPSNP